MIALRAAAIPLAASVSHREINWGGADAMYRYLSGLVDYCTRFPEPHGWETDAVVADVLTQLIRGRRTA
jgi:hypothetical protein